MAKFISTMFETQSLISYIISNWQSVIMGFFWLCVMISVIAFIHEWGHYIAARFCGVKVEEFSIGMGREVASIVDKKTGVKWKICMFPIGGYVKMLGQSDTPSSKKIKYISKKEFNSSFENKSNIEKILIAVMGPVMNFVLAFCLVWGIYTIHGKDKIKPIASKVEVNSPAFIGGIRDGDKIVSFNNNKVSDFKEIMKLMYLNKNCDQINFTIERNSGVIKNLTVDPKSKLDNGDILCKLGIVANDFENVKYGFYKSFGEAKNSVNSMIKGSFKGIYEMISGSRSFKELSGPLKIGKLSHEASKYGLLEFLMLMVVISVGVGVANLLPIPVLDGGHIVMSIVAIIIRRDVPEKIQKVIYNIGFLLVLLLMTTGFINDFVSLIQ
jgi:regulator of sigma E protease